MMYHLARQLALGLLAVRVAASFGRPRLAAEIDAICDRCQGFTKIFDHGVGLNRNHHGLCDRCKKKESWCQNAKKDLQGQIDHALQKVRYWTHEAEKAWLEALRTLGEAAVAFDQYVRGRRLDAAGALAAWQDQVRRDGFPPEYEKTLTQAGMSEPAIHAFRDRLLAFDPKEAAQLHAAFADRLLPQVFTWDRSRGGAADVLPPGDADWAVLGIGFAESLATLGRGD